MKEFFKAKGTKIVIALIVIIVVFQLGVFVGFHKARFTGVWAENYRKDNFGPRGFWGREIANIPAAHGTFGKIISVASSSLIVADRSNTEKSVAADQNTIVRKFMNDIAFKDLRVGDVIVVVGTPTEDGKIKATLIRVMPDSDK